MAEPSVHEPNLSDVHGNSLCDHHSIQAVLSFEKPKQTVKEITFWKWKNVDFGEFSKDITLDTPNENSSIAQIVDHYNTIIHDAVEKHAPLTKNLYYFVRTPSGTLKNSVTQNARDAELRDYSVTQDWRFIDKFSETQPPKQQNSYIKPNKTFFLKRSKSVVRTTNNSLNYQSH